MPDDSLMDDPAVAVGMSDEDAHSWGPWYRPWWKWAIALIWAGASFIGGSYGSAATLAGGAIGSVVGAVVLVYLLTRVSRGLRGDGDA